MKKTIWVIVAICIVVLFVYMIKTRTLVYTNEDFRFSFKYNATYEETYNENTLISLINDNNTIAIDVVATENKDGYTKEISELGIGYVNLLKIFNEDIRYDIINDETIHISGGKTEAREVTVKVNNNDIIQIERAVLIPAPNREITIIVRGTEKAMKNKEKEIDGIISSIRLYEENN